MPRPVKNNIKQARTQTAPILLSGDEAEVMRALGRQEKISRTEISNITGWSKAKTSQEIRSLVGKGFLVEVGEGASQGGRKPRLLRLNDQLGYLVGMDIGATSIDLVLTDVGGKVIQSRSEPADVRQPPDAFFTRCCKHILDNGCIAGMSPRSNPGHRGGGAGSGGFFTRSPGRPSAHARLGKFSHP